MDDFNKFDDYVGTKVTHKDDGDGPWTVADSFVLSGLPAPQLWFRLRRGEDGYIAAAAECYRWYETK